MRHLKYMTHNTLQNQRNKEEQRKNRRSEEQRADELREKQRHNIHTEVTGDVNAAANVGKALSGKRGILGGLFNHPSWYMQKPALVNSSAQLSFNFPAGLPLTLKGDTNFSPVGISIIEWVPMIGTQYLKQKGNYAPGPINLAAQDIYMFVRHANNGSSNYDPSDLMMYILAVGSAFNLISEFIRVYKIMSTVDPKNRWLLQPLVDALGFNYSDLNQHFSNFREVINRYIIKLQSFAIPNGFTYFDRQVWMASNVFVDEKDIRKSAFVAYRQRFHWRWIDGEGYLGFLPHEGKDKWTVADCENALLTVIDPLYSSEDVGIMSGDILKAYGTAGIRQLTPINESSPLPFVYDVDVNSQLRNTTIIGQVRGNDIIVKQQDNGVIYQGNDPAGVLLGQSGEIYHDANTDNLPHIPKLLIDCEHEEPDAGEVLVATRMSFTTKITQSSGYSDEYVLAVDRCGTEIAVGIVTYYIRDGANSNRSFSNLFFKNIPTEVVVGKDDEGKPITEFVDTIDDEYAYYLEKVSTFTCAPKAYKSGTTNYSLISYVAGNTTNFTVLDPETIGKLHETAVISEFTGPQLTASKY